MSALLPLAAAVSELNIFTELGYTTREFFKRPHVLKSVSYESALLLLHYSEKLLPNRISPSYRNHFALYRTNNALILVRSETTLIYSDHDASLEYDLIEPVECARASCVDDNRWTVSFDRIKYSNARPAFLKSFLICSGEWWYFDKGVCLNGISSYVKNTQCASMFIYLELHAARKVIQQQQLDFQNRLLRHKKHLYPQFLTNVQQTVATLPPPIVTKTNITQQQSASSSSPYLSSSSSFSILTNNNNNNNTNKNKEKTTNTITTTTSSSSSRPEISVENNKYYRKKDDDDDNDDGGGDKFIDETEKRLKIINEITTLNADITSTINTNARQLIVENDAVTVPKVEFFAMVPSLYWFQMRSKELCSGDITYFLPTTNALPPPLPFYLNNY